MTPERKEYYKKYYETNKETISKKKKEYHEKNKEAINASKRFRRSSPEERLKQQEYRERNKEQDAERKRKWNEENKARKRAVQREYYLRNKEKHKARTSRKAYSGFKKVYPKASPEHHATYMSTTHCQCCGVEFTPENKKCQDHNHDTQELRDVICLACNSIEGFARDITHLEQLINYLKKYPK